MGNDFDYTGSEDTTPTDEIKHLDFNPDMLQQITLAAGATLEELGAEIDQAVVVVHEKESGGTRVFWLGHPDHAYVTLERGVRTMRNAL